MIALLAFPHTPTMHIVYTRHKVKDYAMWRKTFDDNSPMLTENAITWEIVQVNGDPTDVAIICRCADKAAWEAFVAKDQAKYDVTGENPWEKGGLLGPPEWWAGDTVN